MREEDGATWAEKSFNRRGCGEKREDRREDSEYGSARSNDAAILLLIISAFSLFSLRSLWLKALDF